MPGDDDMTKKREPKMERSLTRRRFTATAAAVAAPLFIPAAALGRGDKPAPSERIVLGSIGWGMMGPNNTGHFLREKDCQVVAVCDLDEEHRRAGVERVNKHYGNKDCRGYLDYHTLLGRRDIDAVMIAVPDHWHALAAVEAAELGKDIYGEKPLAHTFAEQRAIVDAVRRNGRIWQTGSWQRSQGNFRIGAELVRNGVIGKVRRVEVGLPSGHNDFAGTGEPAAKPTKPPEHIHYDMWLGPSQPMAYSEARHHKTWRWNYNVGGGQLMDWIGHHCDIAHWGLGNDDRIGPLRVKGEAEFPPRDAVWNTATKYRIECAYPGGVELIIASNNHDGIEMGTRWEGEDGWVYVNRGGKIETSNPEWIKKDFDPGDVELYESNNHWRNFLDCVRSRESTIAPVEVAHRSATPGHLGYISSALGREIHWDPEAQRIENDEAAHRMLNRPMREPWTLGG